MRNENIIKFAKLRESVTIPSKLSHNACYDVYANFEENSVVLKPYETKLISTGIISAFDEKYMISLRERGTNTKNKLKVSAGIIDSSYRGEWFVALYNTTDHNIMIDKNVEEIIMQANTLHVPYCKAICQAKIEEVPVIEIMECSIDDIKSIPSERGEGMLGSSGK